MGGLPVSVFVVAFLLLLGIIVFIFRYAGKVIDDMSVRGREE